MSGRAPTEVSKGALGARLLALGLVAVLLAVPARASAEADWPIDLKLPDLDWAVGVGAAAAFGDKGGKAETGLLLAADVSFLHSMFGATLGVRAYKEGAAWRVGGLAEVTFWYLVMIGVGASIGWMTADGGPRARDQEVAIHAMLGVPFPMWSIEDGARGTMVAMPYARPMMRFEAHGDIEGFYEIGLMLKWTSFGY